MKGTGTELILALGSNIGDRLVNLNNAIIELVKRFGQPVASSNVYESKPVDYLDQPQFLNMVLLFRVPKTFSSKELLEITQGLEILLGRQKVIPKGPRNIDIDILFVNNEKINSAELVLPHPGISERDFVIYPLQEIRKAAEVINIPLPNKLVKNELEMVAPCSQIVQIAPRSI